VWCGHISIKEPLHLGAHEVEEQESGHLLEPGSLLAALVHIQLVHLLVHLATGDTERVTYEDIQADEGTGQLLLPLLL